MGDIRDRRQICIECDGSGEADDLAGGMRAKLRRIGGVVNAWVRGIFFHLQHIDDRIFIGAWHFAVVILQVRIVLRVHIKVVMKFVAANVILGFMLGAVFVDLPGEELIKAVAVEIGAVEQIGAAIAWLGEHLSSVGILEVKRRCRRLI